MRRIKEKITKLKNRRKPNKNYSKTSRLRREVRIKKLEKEEIKQNRIEILKYQRDGRPSEQFLAEKGEKMKFLILEERLVPDLNNQVPKEKEDKPCLKDSPTLLPKTEKRRARNILPGLLCSIWKWLRRIPV